MAMPVYVNFHNMKRCEKLENAIFLRAGKLKTLYGGATSCRVAVIASKHHENRLKVLDVVVDLSIPGKDFVARSRAEGEVCPNASVAEQADGIPYTHDAVGFAAATGVDRA
jgi:proline racemase